MNIFKEILNNHKIKLFYVQLFQLLTFVASKFAVLSLLCGLDALSLQLTFEEGQGICTKGFCTLQHGLLYTTELFLLLRCVIMSITLFPWKNFKST